MCVCFLSRDMLYWKNFGKDFVTAVKWRELRNARTSTGRLSVKTIEWFSLLAQCHFQRVKSHFIFFTPLTVKNTNFL